MKLKDFSNGTETPVRAPGRGAAIAGRWAERAALASLALYAIAAPHSIALAWIGLSFAVLGWLVRTLATGEHGIRRTMLDAPLWLLYGWTILSSIFSVEPRVSLAKLISAGTFLVFYLMQSLLTRRRVVLTATLLIASASAGALWSVGEVIVGRGMLVREVKPNSPFLKTTPLQAGDAVWRAGGRRVSTPEEIDEAIRRTPPGERLSLSVISRGEHVEWDGPVVTQELKSEPSPSLLVGGGRTHNFRASGLTRHYQTFAESLQIIAQLALGFALAAWRRRREMPLRPALLAFAAFLLPVVGIVLTAMRTVLVAFAVGASVVAWRAATRGRARLLVLTVIVCALACGALVVGRTRGDGAVMLKDDSTALRFQVARVALARAWQHPLFGHGMDAVKLHWDEWGFPGEVQIHTHSTPVQLVFDRGLPALILWLWMVCTLWLLAARSERMWRASDDVGTHALLLGATGALAGFFASSLVNYNFGDSEVTLLFWWLMGAVVVCAGEKAVPTAHEREP